MKTPKTLIAGTAAVGAAWVGCQQAPAPATLARAQPFEYEYGPREVQALAKGGSVLGAFDALGAPYATYQVGDKTVYRWGHGKLSRSADGQASLQRDELLITAGPDGTILDTSYKPKISLQGPFDLVADAPF